MRKPLIILVFLFGLVVIWIFGLFMAIAVGPPALQGSRMLTLRRHGFPEGAFGDEIARMYIISDLTGFRTEGPVRIKSRYDYDDPESTLTLERPTVASEAEKDRRTGRIREMLAAEHVDVTESTLDAWAHDVDRLAQLMVSRPEAAWDKAASTELEYDEAGNVTGPPLADGWSLHVVGPGEAPYQVAPSAWVVTLIWLGIGGVGTVGMFLVARRLWKAGESTAESSSPA